MKQLLCVTIMVLLSNLGFGQVSGNINYDRTIRYSGNNIDVEAEVPSNVTSIIVKGMANLKADSYVAIFSVTQVGKTTQEVNQLIDSRIYQGLDKIKNKPNVETFVDMISFVPIYEYDVEKKLFSRKTYNEVPKGFELKKNIHIQYKDPNVLNDLITSLSAAEIYDLVRVDYFSSEIETIKKELRTKAQTILQEKSKNYETILGRKLDSVNKSIVDGFKVVLPVEMYQSYRSYSSSSLNLKRSAQVNSVNKSSTSYYQPIVDKEFDFVMNPIILEPVIQVMYEIKLNIKNVTEKNNKKEYILINQNGDFKSLDLE